MTKKLKFDPLPSWICFGDISEKEIMELKIPRKDLITKYLEGINEVTYIRGIIINQVISIEKAMDCIIALYFSENMKKPGEFGNIILSKPQVTFFLKWKILKEIIENKIFDDVKDKKKIIRDLHDVMEIRDNFAHGFLEFDMKSKKSFIEYYRDGIKKEEINQEYLDNIHEKLGYISDKLNRMFVEITKEKSGKYPTHFYPE